MRPQFEMLHGAGAFAQRLVLGGLFDVACGATAEREPLRRQETSHESPAASFVWSTMTTIASQLRGRDFL